MRVTLICLPLLAGLAACDLDTNADKASPEAGTSAAINAQDDSGGDVHIAADGETGRVALNLPGIDATIRLPKMLLKDSNFDLDGVTLYPGSSISTVNVDAGRKAGRDSALVKLVFSAPAEVSQVRSWFLKAFADKSVSVRQEGDALIGKSADGNDFTLNFAPGKGNTTTGTILISDQT